MEFPWYFYSSNLIFFLSALTLGITPTSAQLIPDNTLGAESSQLNQNMVTQIITITDGATRGINLFHSFQEFNVQNGETVLFDNPNGVTNILTRVTGNNASQILGTLGVNGTANLFLINPHGITFGPNVQLNLSGSLTAGTADAIKLGENAFFSATDITNSSLLNVQPGALFNHALRNYQAELNYQGNSVFAPGHLTLQGDIINITGSLTASGGSINFHSLGDINFTNSTITNTNGSIGIQGENVTLHNSPIISQTSTNQAAADITVNAEASLSLRGSSSGIINQGAIGGSGEIKVTTPNLSITDGARIQTLALGDGAAGKVTVNAPIITISGFATPQANLDPLDQIINSRISSETFAQGAVGEVHVTTQQLTLLDGGEIATWVHRGATGHGSPIIVNASESITATGATSFNPLLISGIASYSFSTARGGDVKVATSRLNLDQGGGILSFVGDEGNGGDIDVNVTESLIATGVNSVTGNNSGIQGTTFGRGDSGNVRISAPKIQLFSGAALGSSVINQFNGRTLPGAGEGDGGDVRVEAKEVEVVGISPVNQDNPSRISSLTFGLGKAGNVALTVEKLNIKEGATVSSTVATSFSLLGQPITDSGKGTGGNLVVDASKSIDITGVNPVFLLPSLLGTGTAGSGDAGNTFITTPQLRLSRSGGISSGTIASGNAGKLNINATEIVIDGRDAQGLPSGIDASATIASPLIQQSFSIPQLPTGNTGQVTINTSKLTVSDGGQVVVRHQGTGDAGTLAINADSILLERRGRINASTALGTGGNILLDVKGLLLLRDRSSITAEALGGKGNGGNLNIKAQFIVAVPIENSDVIARAAQGRGGNILLTAEGIYGFVGNSRQLTPFSDLNASSDVVGNEGNIQTITGFDVTQGINQLPESLVDAESLVDRNACAIADDKIAGGSSFRVMGRGGLPSSPRDALSTTNTMLDWATLPNQQVGEQRESTSQLGITEKEEEEEEKNYSQSYQQAQGWVVDEEGKVFLTALAPQATLHSSIPRQPHCLAQ